MLRLAGGRVESLFDELLPVEVRELPADLAALDWLLADRLLLASIEGVWEPSARGRGAQAKLRAARRLEDLAERCQRVAIQIQQLVRGEKISDRLVSLSGPDARPIRKGKLGRPGEFGYVAQIARGHRQHPTTRRGARG
jgi:hypothetical protein